MADVKRAAQSVAGERTAPDETSEKQRPTDAEILEKASCDITLAGRTYHWDELGNRVSRSATARMLERSDRWKKMIEADTTADPTIEMPKEFKSSYDKAGILLKTAEQMEWEWTAKYIIRKYPQETIKQIDWMLDFMYTFHEGMEKDKEFLDKLATSLEISDAFALITPVVNAPFLRAAAKVRADVKEKTIPTPTT